MTQSSRRGILLVAFGCTVDRARETYTDIEHRVRERFHELPVYWAYTSKTVRRLLRDRGILSRSVTGAIDCMLEDGIDRIAVQSLHIIAGAEFDQMRTVVERLQHGPECPAAISLGWPLLATAGDLRRALTAALAELAARRAGDDAVVMVGHGNGQHPADLAYSAANAMLQSLDSRAYLGTLEGFPTIDQVIASCLRDGVGKAWLMPFIAVAGGHFERDIDGESPQSWRSRFRHAGIDAQVVRLGLAEIPAVVDIWLDHLAAALAPLR